jgi:hypothetical protein
MRSRSTSLVQGCLELTACPRFGSYPTRKHAPTGNVLVLLYTPKISLVSFSIVSFAPTLEILCLTTFKIYPPLQLLFAATLFAMASTPQYLLSRGLHARIRLNFQHWAMKRICGGLIHPSITMRGPASVADLGTGTAYVVLLSASSHNSAFFGYFC